MRPTYLADCSSEIDVAARGIPADAPREAGAEHVDERNAAPFLRGLDARSHGESFMDLFTSRIRPGGLYLLDEPEAPLSPKRQVAFVRLMRRAAEDGAQFVVATHSPILLSCPCARIYSFDDPPVHEVNADALEHLTVTRAVLADARGVLGDGTE